MSGDTRHENLFHDVAGCLLWQGNAYTNGGAAVTRNQLTSHLDKRTPESRCTYQYDEFGRVISEKRGQSKPCISRYEYDCQHRMTKAILPDGRQAIYKYDAFGRRIKKTITDKSGHQKTTEFLWQGDNLIAETDNKDHYQSYIYEPGSFKPLALIVGRGKEHKVYHYQLDHIGTPLDLTNTEGKAVWSAQYLAYGTIYTQHAEEVTNPLRFQGQYFDQETGLHYNRHRYYNPKSGLFATADPIGLAGGLNNYQYVKNPTGWVDPLGLTNVVGDCQCLGGNTGDIANLAAFHAVTSPNAATGVLNGIDPKFFNPDSRFGAAFYVAQRPETTLAELAHHGATATHGIRFDFNASNANILDLTNPSIAKAWGYNGGPISSTTQQIGLQAQEKGFNVIRFASQRDLEGVNYAILDDFNMLLVPQFVSPAKP